MISEELRARIRRLYYGEHWTVGTIASQLDIHHETVRRAACIDRLTNKGYIRPSALDPYIEFIRETLEQYPRLTATRLHEMLRLRGYLGSVKQIRRRIRKLGLRPSPKSEAYFRLTTMPGEQAQVDWGYFGKIKVSQTERKVWFFVMLLSWSRAVHVIFSFDQGIASMLRGHVESFTELGGAARNVVYDNMRTVVLERIGDAIRFHPRLVELASHYLFAPCPCNPGRGNEKGRVERKIRDLRSSLFAGRRFTSLEDLNRKFITWRDEVAYQRPCPADKSLTVAEALEVERKHLLPLPEHPFDASEVRPVIAKKQPYVFFDTNSYSIPYKLVGQPLTLVADEKQVRVLCGNEVVARHSRTWERNQVVEDRDHIKGLVQAKRKARVLKGRELLLAEVPEAEDLFFKLAERNEPLGPQTKTLLNLLDLAGAKSLGEAIQEALQKGTPYATSVANIIERKRREESQSLRCPLKLPDRPQVQDLHVKNHNLEDYDDIGDEHERES